MEFKIAKETEHRVQKVELRRPANVSVEIYERFPLPGTLSQIQHGTPTFSS